MAMGSRRDQWAFGGPSGRALINERMDCCGMVLIRGSLSSLC